MKHNYTKLADREAIHKIVKEKYNGSYVDYILGLGEFKDDPVV